MKLFLRQTGSNSLRLRDITIALGCAVILSAQGVSDLRSEIVSDLKAGKYVEAKRALDGALGGSPNDASLWTLNGFALLHLGQEKEALASYNRAIGILPDYLPALEGAAEIEFQASDPHAIPLLEKILKANPRDETAHGMLAALAYKSKDCAGAINQFAQAQHLIDSHTQALEEYGFCLVKLKRTADAIPVFQRLSNLQPQNERARYNLALVQSLSGHYQEVIETLKAPDGTAPKDSESLALLAEAYEATTDTPRAVAYLRQAIIASPDVANYYVDFANLCLSHASFQVGIDMLNVGLKRMPQSAPLYLARGILYIQLGQYNQSEEDFASAEKLDPTLQYGTAARGLAELQQNNLAQAEVTVRERLKKNPREAFLHYLLAEILLRKGAAPGSAEFAEALSLAQRAVELQPTLALARDVLGRLYVQQGKIEEAIKQSRLAFEQDPADQTALYHLIMALRKGRKTEEIPPLAKKLAELREQARLKEAAAHKYALVEAAPAEGSK